MAAALTLASLLGISLVLLQMSYGPVLPELLHRIGWPSPAFDSEQWKAADRNDLLNVRGRMVWSLLDEHELVGMSRAQVTKLLGKPEYVWVEGQGVSPAERAAQLAEARTFEYVLSWYSPQITGPDYLRLYFDDDDTVTRWEWGMGSE